MGDRPLEGKPPAAEKTLNPLSVFILEVDGRLAAAEKRIAYLEAVVAGVRPPVHVHSWRPYDWDPVANRYEEGGRLVCNECRVLTFAKTVPEDHVARHDRGTNTFVYPFQEGWKDLPK